MRRNATQRQILVTRREAIACGAAAGAAALLAGAGCKDGNGAQDAATGGIDAAPDDLGAPEVSGALWQTMSPYVRASADGGIGTRVNIYNPTPDPSRVDIQVFHRDGRLAVKDTRALTLAPGQSHHLELGEYLAAHGVVLPFAGSMWVGAQPDAAAPTAVIGLQGINFDWYGPRHMASVHGMRDFGNSNHDAAWSDLIFPKLAAGTRYVTRVALLNASGDGVSEALVAHPHLVLRADDGTELASQTLPDLLPHASVLIDVPDLLGSAQPESGTIQITDAEVGLVAVAFLWDLEWDGIVSADHLFDRHFVVGNAGFSG